MDFSNTGISFDHFSDTDDGYGFTLVEIQYMIGIFLSTISISAVKKQVERNSLEISGPLNVILGLTDDLIVVGINDTKATINSKSLLTLKTNKTEHMSVEEIKDSEKNVAREVIGTEKLNFFFFSRKGLEAMRDMVKTNSSQNIAVDMVYEVIAEQTAEWITQHATSPTSRAYYIYIELNKSADEYVSTIKKGLNVMEINPKFRARNIVVKQNMGFYVLPFTDSPLQALSAIKKGIQDEKVDCDIVKSEDSFDPSRGNSIIENIWIDICRSRFVIADLSEKNPNVFYELGICDTIGKTVISICSNKSKKDDYPNGLPFDVAGEYTLFYDENWDGYTDLQHRVVDRIRAILELNNSVED